VIAITPPRRIGAAIAPASNEPHHGKAGLRGPRLRDLALLALASALAIAPDAVMAAPSHRMESYDWRAVPWGGGGYIPGFLYHPKKVGILYARTDVGGLYRYDYQNQTWIPLLDDLSRPDGDLQGVLSVAIDPNDPNKVYAACGMYISQWARKGAIMRSNDQGKTWQKFDLPIGIGGNSNGRGTGERLIVDPADGNTLYYGSNQDGLWKSTNGGASFAKVGTPSKSISLMFFDPKDHTLYLGAVDGAGALMASKDGTNFTVASSTPAMIPQHMAKGQDGSLYVTFARGDKDHGGEINPSDAAVGAVWKRDPDGTWHDITPLKPGPDRSFGYSGVDVGPDGTVAVSTIDRWWPGDEIFVSRDGGKNWIPMHDHVTINKDDYPWTKAYGVEVKSMGGWVSDVKINPFNKNELIYQGQGAWVATNLGDLGSSKPVNVVFADAGIEETATIDLTVPPVGAKVMAAFGDNAGAAWFDTTQTPDAGLFVPAKESNRSIDYAGLKPAYVVRSSDASKHFAFISHDGGLHWEDMPNSIFETPGSGFPVQNWHNGGRVAISAGATSMVWASDRGLPFYSKDGGKTWIKSAGVTEAKDRMLSPVADKRIDHVFYILDPTGTVLISIDGGVSFKPLITGLPQISNWENATLAPVPTHIRDLWIVMPKGLLHSADSDHPAKNAPDVTEAWAVGFGAPRVADAYPAVYLSGKVKDVAGFWRSDDEGKTWVEITDHGHHIERINILAGDMQHFGVVYANSLHGGIMVSQPEKPAP